MRPENVYLSEWDIILQEKLGDPLARKGLDQMISTLLRIGGGFSGFRELAKDTRGAESSEIEDWELYKVNNYIAIRDGSPQFTLLRLKANRSLDFMTSNISALRARVIHEASTWWAVMGQDERSNIQSEMMGLNRGVSPLMSTAVSPRAWTSSNWFWYFREFLREPITEG